MTKKKKMAESTKHFKSESAFLKFMMKKRPMFFTMCNKRILKKILARSLLRRLMLDFTVSENQKIYSVFYGWRHYVQ